MNAFTTLTSKVIPLLHDDVDTDQIVPARFLKVTDKAGLGDALFADWRAEPSFVLNAPEHASREVMLTGDNFGCGSSREHAPWALVGWGVRALIATSFADIFRSNSLKNGLLPVEVSSETHASLVAQLEADPQAEVHIDLASQTLSLPDGTKVTFEVDAFAKKCLLAGSDQLGYLLGFADQIATFEEEAGR